MKQLFIYDIQWSQTEVDTVIIQETSRATALARLKSRYPGARFINFVRVSQVFIE
jgi:hypothetical protein